MKSAFIFITFIFLSLKAPAQGKAGYIDYDSVIQMLPSYAPAIKEFKALTSLYDDSLKLLTKQLTDFMDNGIPHRRSVNALEQELLDDTLGAMESKIQNYLSYFENRLFKAQETLNEKLKNELRAVLKEYCLNNKISFIADMKAILYCAGCIDYTEEVIDFLKSRK